jgi:hypothetical protein
LFPQSTLHPSLEGDGFVIAAIPLVRLFQSPAVAVVMPETSRASLVNHHAIEVVNVRTSIGGALTFVERMGLGVFL